MATGVILFAAFSFDARAPAQADSRAAAYSIHMLAKIPSRCTLRDVSRFMMLTRDTAFGDAAVDHGRARFRVECNVPYVLDTATRQNFVRSSARLIPLAAEGGDISMPLLPDESRTHNTESVSTRCTLVDGSGRLDDCPSRENMESAAVMPRAVGEVHLLHSSHLNALDNALDVAPARNNLNDDAGLIAIEIGARP